MFRNDNIINKFVISYSNPQDHLVDIQLIYKKQTDRMHWGVIYK